nr:PREDICTED: venom serine protease 34-like [Megachile rotundata]
MLSLCWLTPFVKADETTETNCTYVHNLTSEEDYYIYNPEFPKPYRGPQSCSWTINSDYRVNVVCKLFELPSGFRCLLDNLTVEASSNSIHRFCGNDAVNVTSDGPTMVVKLFASVWSTGGRFLCDVMAVKKPSDAEGCECGWRNPNKIVGGMDAGVNEFPMMAGLVDFRQRNITCGSTIISNRYATTAAHCFKNGTEPRDYGLLVGDHDLRTGTDTNATVLHRLRSITIHPDYRKNPDVNDIAIVKAELEIKFSNQVGPACLPFQHSPDTFGGSYVELLGWGLTEFGGLPPTVLQKVSLSVLTNLECSKTYQNVTSSRLCTYGQGKDSCQMDSGGPVLWQNPTSRRLVLIGVINQGIDCGIFPSLNMRVGAYTDWIVSVTSDASYCISE